MKKFLYVLCAGIVSVSFAPFAVAVDNYANAQFDPIYLSECISNINRIVPQFTSVPENKTYMHVRHHGDDGTDEQTNQVANSVSWDVSQLSGYKPPSPMSNWQRGYYDVGLPDGTSAVQLKCHDAGYLINTWQFNHINQVVGGGPNVTLSREFNPLKSVWNDSSSELTIQVYYKLPWLLRESAAVGQASLFYLLAPILHQ